MMQFVLDGGGRVLVDPSAVDAVSENTVPSRSSPTGQKTLVEVVLHSGRSYSVLDEEGDLVERIAEAKMKAVNPTERLAAALETLGIGATR